MKIKVQSAVLLKVIAMGSKQLYILMLLLVIGCQQATISQDKPTLPPDTTTVAPSELDKQLRIYKSALLEGKNEQIRVEAATEILFNENPLAREILLEILKQTENSPARIAVCKALIQARSKSESVKDKKDFIQPLLNIFNTDVPTEAQLAAEATLIFEYDTIEKPLESIITDASQQIKTKLNAIYALKLQPDKRAAIKLLQLVDNPEKQIADAAVQALHSLAIPVGKDQEARLQIISELQRKEKDEFLRDWLIRQEEQIRTMKTELNLWQSRYLAALGNIYDAITDDTAKGKFLAGHLASQEPIVKLWALEKVRQDRVGTRTNPKLLTEVGPALINLISDQNHDVRLRTARLLSLMGELNSAESLLTQLELEQDDEVKLEMFVALGGACYYASLPNSNVKIPQKIREQTLQWAEKYLSDSQATKVQKAAEVIRRLLEQNGLAADFVDKYLGLLVQRYDQIKDPSEATLRADLLNAMSGLCAQGSACKVKAANLFKPLFEESLNDRTNNRVREAAIDGLVYIDKSSVLKRLRKDFVDDPSDVVRKKVINLAGEVGSDQDLQWLTKKIGTTSDGDLAWKAIIKIFIRADTNLLSQWLVNFESQDLKDKLSDEQRVAFLLIAEQKAVGENNQKMLKSVRAKLSRTYVEKGEFELAENYLELLRESANTIEEKEEFLSELLNVYLRWPKVELAVKLVENCLNEQDLEPNSLIVRTIDSYFNKSDEKADMNALLQMLNKINIKIPEARPKWQQQLKYWAEKLNKTDNSENSNNRSS